MQAVRRLVGLDANQPGIGAVDRRHEDVEVGAAELVGEGLLQRLVPVGPERPAAADEVLPGSALRLVQAERRRIRERCPLERGADAVGVEAVPGFVHRRPERVEPGRLVPRREPYIASRERGAEGVDGRIESPRPVLEADRRENPFSECALQLGRVGNVEERRVDPRRLTHQLGEHGPDRVEDLRHLGRLHQRLEVVQERGVGRVVPLEALGVALLQVEVPLERREEGGEVVVRAGVDPDLVSLRPGRSISVRRSVGTRLAFSQSRRVTRIRLASSESCSSDSSYEPSLSRSVPISPSTNFSWAIRPSVATASARAGPPSVGMFTR